MPQMNHGEGSELAPAARRWKPWSWIVVLTVGMAGAVATAAAIVHQASPHLTIYVQGVSAPWASDGDSRHTKVAVKDTSDKPVAVTVWHDGRNVLSFPEVQPGQIVDFRIFKDFAQGSWVVKASEGSNHVSVAIPVAMRWAPMPGADPTFEPCQIVRWHLDPTQEPSNGALIRSDIQAALGEIALATGLTFTEVSDQAAADLTYGWTMTGTEWKAGVAGMRTLPDGRRLGYVKLNADDQWLTRPGFDFVGGKPGRGVLILHETGHALGLGHVNDISQIMNPTPVGEGVSHLGDGDRAGLAWMYRPETCSKKDGSPA